ncbi:MAG: amino acid permease [Propionibacteriales bacterium]|nr:amino acid permease [Propionibacteriales bacterium]
MAAWSGQLLRRKPTADYAAEAEGGGGTDQLRRTLGLLPLMMIGIGGTVGTGIFFVLNQAVPVAGPAVIISFLVAGVVAGLTALCYAELASSVPVSGSSYSYAYATLGEMPAMAVAACLMLEYGVSTAAVSVGWSEYLNELLNNLFGLTIPAMLSSSPEQGGLINLPAMVLVALCTLLLIRGASESTTVNTIMVFIKLAVLALFAVIAIQGWSVDNFANFAPFGASGITLAAGVIFFSFIGLDCIATAGEEAKNPQRNLPLALIGALIVVIAVYMVVAVVAVGAQPWTEFEGQQAGLAAILTLVTGSNWPATVLAAGAIISIFSVTLVTLYGQTRIMFSMSRDGMMPPIFHRVNRRTMTPVPNTLIVGAVIALLAGLIPLNFLAEMTSIGALTAFIVVAVGVIVLRRRKPDLSRGFSVPLYPITPILAIVGCLWIIKDLRPITLIVFGVWTVIFLVVYLLYGRRHSLLGQKDLVR